MTKNNIYLPKENIAKVETVQELKKCEIKKSPLSKDARSKVIRKWGGNCVSEKKDNYGPCSGCSNSSTFELEMIIKNSRGGWRSRTVYNVGAARSNASEISKRENWWDDSNTNKFSNKERDNLVDKINKAVEEHINSCKNINRTVINDVIGDDPSPCSVIM